MTTQHVRVTFQVTIKRVDPSDHATLTDPFAVAKTVYKIHASSPLSEYERRYLGTVAQYPFGRGRQRWQIIDAARGGGPLRHNLNGDWYDTRAEAIQDLVLRGRFAAL